MTLLALPLKLGFEGLGLGLGFEAEVEVEDGRGALNGFGGMIFGLGGRFWELQC